MRNGRCDNVVVEFGRKVFIVYYKKIKLNVAKRSITDVLKRFHAHETIQGNITAMRYRNGFIRSVLLRIRANLVMMLARD